MEFLCLISTKALNYEVLLGSFGGRIRFKYLIIYWF